MKQVSISDSLYVLVCYASCRRFCPVFVVSCFLWRLCSCDGSTQPVLCMLTFGSQSSLVLPLSCCHIVCADAQTSLRLPFLAQVTTQVISHVGPYKVCRYLNVFFLRAFDVLKPNLIYVCPHHRRCLRCPTRQICGAKGRKSQIWYMCAPTTGDVCV